MVISAAV